MTTSLSWEQYQATQAETRKRLQGMGGSNYAEPAWKKRMNNFNPKGTKTWVRLRPDWYLYYSKWYGTGTKRMVISNSHNGELMVPDLVFMHAEQRNDPKLFANRQVAATTTVLEYFHEVEEPNRKDPKKKGYLTYVRCGGVDSFKRPNCKLCTDGVKKVFGQQKHWSMSPKSRDELEDEMQLRKRMCLNCCVGEVQVAKYACVHCNVILLDRYTEAVSDEDAAVLENPDGVECPHCGKAGVPTRTYDCAVYTGSSYEKGCDKPTPVPAEAGIYDMEYLVEQDPSDYTISIPKFRLAQNHPDLPRHMLDGLDLYSTFSHMTLDEQSKGLGIPNPFGAEGEAAVAAFFKQTAPAPAKASQAAPEEADETSIPWSRPRV
jgi:hypothetical protein